jgi:chromosomal replication initiation ATPase DnaA
MQAKHTIPWTGIRRELALVRASLDRLQVAVDSRLGSDTRTVVRDRHARAQRIIETVALHFEVPVANIMSRSRVERITWPRFVAMYLIRRYTRLSTPSIGALFDRNHGTVLHALRVVQNRIETDVIFRAELTSVDALCLNGVQPSPARKS